MYRRWKILAKRKLSAYNKHVGKEMRAGKTMKQAAASWRKGSTRKRATTSKPKRRRTTTAKPKKRGGGGKKTFGTFGTVGLLSAGILYGIAKYIARSYFPQAGAYTGAISAVAAGGTAKALNLSGKSLFGFGLVELVSELLTDLILPGGLVNAPWVGAGAKTMRYNV